MRLSVIHKIIHIPALPNSTLRILHIPNPLPLLRRLNQILVLQYFSKSKTTSCQYSYTSKPQETYLCIILSHPPPSSSKIFSTPLNPCPTRSVRFSASVYAHATSRQYWFPVTWYA